MEKFMKVQPNSNLVFSTEDLDTKPKEENAVNINFFESETISNIIFNKIISLTITESNRQAILQLVPEYCYSICKNHFEEVLELYFIRRDYSVSRDVNKISENHSPVLATDSGIDEIDKIKRNSKERKTTDQAEKQIRQHMKQRKDVFDDEDNENDSIEMKNILTELSNKEDINHHKANTALNYKKNDDLVNMLEKVNIELDENILLIENNKRFSYDFCHTTTDDWSVINSPKDCEIDVCASTFIKYIPLPKPTKDYFPNIPTLEEENGKKKKGKVTSKKRLNKLLSTKSNNRLVTEGFESTKETPYETKNKLVDGRKGKCYLFIFIRYQSH